MRGVADPEIDIDAAYFLRMLFQANSYGWFAPRGMRKKTCDMRKAGLCEVEKAGKIGVRSHFSSHTNGGYVLIHATSGQSGSSRRAGVCRLRQAARSSAQSPQHTEQSWVAGPSLLGDVLKTGSNRTYPQRAQYCLIKEYTLNHIQDPYMI